MHTTLSENDYVIYDKANDHVLEFERSGEIIIYGSKEEAQEDCRGNEYVVKATDLPKHHIKRIVEQLK